MTEIQRIEKERDAMHTGPEKIDLATIAASIKEGGIRASSLMAVAEDDSRYGENAGIRRKGLLTLKAVSLIKSGKLSKRELEATPVVVIDTDNECYSPSENSSPGSVIKGEFLEKFTHFNEVPERPPEAPVGMTLEAARRHTAANPQEALKEMHEHNVETSVEGPNKTPKSGGMKPLTPEHFGA